MKLVFRRGVEALRQPDRLPRCYELTDEERLDIIKKQHDWDDIHTATPEHIETYHGYYGA